MEKQSLRYITTDDLLPIQQELLTITDAFIKACDTLQLRYYAAFGTLLGVIRHHGFIPWDDDVDFIMPRKDYEVFLKIGQKYLPEHLFIEHFTTESECPFSFIKIRDSHTACFEIDNYFLKINQGFWIDIFPIDGAPSDSLRFLNQSTLQKSLSNYQNKWRDSSAIQKNNIKNFVYSIVLDFSGSKKKLHSQRDVVVTLDQYHKKLDFDKCKYSWAFLDFRFKKEFLGDCPRFGDFCGLRLRIPEMAERWLTSRYGDYLQLPPETERNPHHAVAYYSLKKPFSEVDIISEVAKH